MFPVFKLKLVLGRGEETQAVIECGDRSITIRRASGETGPDGAFPYIVLTEKTEEKSSESGFCIHMEPIFDEIWDQLIKLAEK